MRELTVRTIMVLGVLAGLMSLPTWGCKGMDDAPTNTANSKYIDSGKTAADIVGRQRAEAHRPRLPGNGATSN